MPDQANSEPMHWLTRDALSTAAIVDRLRRDDAGAIAAFEGVVRAETSAGGRTLAALDYAAYEEMAVEQMRILRDKAMREFELLGAALVHRLGRVPLGEPSIVIVTVAAHRAAALDACRWLIDAVKIDVPIWKKEMWSDGTTTWTDPLKP